MGLCSRYELSEDSSTEGEDERVGMSTDNLYASDTIPGNAPELKIGQPPCKRSRKPSNASRNPALRKGSHKKQGRLAGMMNMPIDIFTEITSYLLPIDIIHLSLSNQYFRDMLLHRSSVHIWHGSMRNVGGLPPCPPDMNEPQYLTLLFADICSKCGKSVKAKIEGELRVRLCTTCRYEHSSYTFVSIDKVQAAIRGYVPRSERQIVPGSKRDVHNQYALSEDVLRLISEYNQIKKLRDKRALDAWRKKKVKNADQRRKETRELTLFLNRMQYERFKELEDLKKARRSEVERRVKASGWAQEDIPSRLSPLYCTWYNLVNQTKPLTERIWAKIQPKLVALLETSRAKRLEKELKQRKFSRYQWLLKIYLQLRCKFVPAFQIRDSKAPALPATYYTTQHSIFPSLTHMLAWPLVKHLYETDSTADEMISKFRKHWDEIEFFINEWRTSIGAHLMSLVPGVGDTIYLRLAVHDGHSNSFFHTPDNIKLLLRADSLYTTSQSRNATPLTYSGLIAQEGWHESIDIQAQFQHPSPKPLRLGQIRWYPEAHEMAKILLISMQKPDASFLEVACTYGYACGRCHETGPLSWEQMVQHYVQKRQMYEIVQKNLSMLICASGHFMLYNDLHDPALRTDLPMIKPYTRAAEPEPKSDDVRKEGLGRLQM